MNDIEKLEDAKKRLREANCKANGGHIHGLWHKEIINAEFVYTRQCKNCEHSEEIHSKDEIETMEKELKKQEKANDILKYLEERAKTPKDILFSIISLYTEDILFHSDIEKFIGIIKERNKPYVDHLEEYPLVEEMITQIKIISTKNGRTASDEDWDKMNDLIEEGRKILNLDSNLEEKAHHTR